MRRVPICVLTLASVATGVALAASSEIPKRTVVPCTAVYSTSSSTSKKGDPFELAVSGRNGYFGIPAGSVFKGKVTDCKPSKNGKGAELDVKLERLMLPGGKTVGTSGEIIPLKETYVRKEPSGILTAVSDKDLVRQSFSIGSDGDLGIKRGSDIGFRLSSTLKFDYTGKTASEGKYENVLVRVGDESISWPRNSGVRKSSGHYVMPIEPVLKEAGCRISYDAAKRTVRIESSMSGYTVPINSKDVRSDDGRKKGVSSKVYADGGVLYGPDDLITMVTGRKANYDSKTKTLTFVKGYE